MAVYPFVEAERAAGKAVTRACTLLEVSRAAHYTWTGHKASQRVRKDGGLSKRIVAIHRGSRGTYGVPRVQEQLRREGIRCSKRRVARLTAAQGLAGRRRRRFKRTTIADSEGEARSADLVQRQFAPQRLSVNQIWVSDISGVAAFRRCRKTAEPATEYVSMEAPGRWNFWTDDRSPALSPKPRPGLQRTTGPGSCRARLGTTMILRTPLPL